MTYAEMAARLVRMGYRAQDLAPRNRQCVASTAAGEIRAKISSALSMNGPSRARDLVRKVGVDALSIAQHLRNMPNIINNGGVYSFSGD